MTKKSANDQRVKTRKKGRRRARGNGSTMSVSGSRSYNAPANPRAPIYLNQHDDAEEGFPEGCAITRADFRTIMGSRMNTPLPRIGADSQLGYRVCTPSEKPEKNDHFLPDINSHITNRIRRLEEQQHVDLDMYDVECIRKTQSGIAFTQFVGRPYRLPRLLSDGQIERHPKPRVSHYASFVPIKSPENRSGGTFADQLRNDVEESRQRREDRNLARFHRQLQEQEGRASRVGRSCDTNEQRVRAVVEEQESIRKANFQKHVRHFMDKRQ